MTYKELLNNLNKLSPEQLDMFDVCVYDCSIDEYLPVTDFSFTIGDDVLDDNHPILIMN